MNNEALTVTLLTRIIQETLENEFPVVRVLGEISNYKQHSSGHRYFTLKDDGAQIRCIMWKTRALGFVPADGMKVFVSGRITLYPAQGNYQIDCFTMTPAGVGDLYLAFEKLKTELQALGYFDADRKKSLPRLPMHVGVATSATGAAVHDILSTMQQRMPMCTVYFRPTKVQGEGSAEDIVQAIRELEEHSCDAIIIGRGGGSIEDLWSFNTRMVADAIYHARTPIISAVGHESDFSIADFVADHRAATPTAAAVLCTPIRTEEIFYDLDMMEMRMRESVAQRLQSMSLYLEDWLGDYMRRIISRMISDVQRVVQQRRETISKSVLHDVRMRILKASNLESTVRGLHPLAPLGRGFAILKRGEHTIGVNEELIQGEHISIHRKIQSAKATIESTTAIEQ